MFNFFFYRLHTATSFQERLAWSVIVQKHRNGKPVSVRGLGSLTRLHAHQTLPGVIATLVELDLVEPPVKGKPLVPLKPATELYIARKANGDEWWDAIAYYPVALYDELQPLSSVLLGVLQSLATQHKSTTYQSSLATIIGCHENTISDHLHRLAKCGRVDWSQTKGSPLTFKVIQKVVAPKPVKLVQVHQHQSPLEAIAQREKFDLESPIGMRLAFLYHSGASAKYLDQYYTLMMYDALPYGVVKEFVREAMTEHRGAPDKWFPLFHYKVKVYGARTGRFVFPGEEVPDLPKPKPKPPVDEPLIGSDWPLREIS
jgi:hypothetical protein